MLNKTLFAMGLPDGSAASPPPVLHISAFNDISAFILASIRQEGFTLRIKYVKNANEAHDDLKRQQADVVFMSYDDTLSMALQDGYRDIAAFLPIHGGLLDLCGVLDPASGKNRVGIDTNTGYARALRLYLRTRDPGGYPALDWQQVGATDRRYAKLRDGLIDATLLNPPFSYQVGITRIAALTGNTIIPHYQGVVANLNKSWWADPSHQSTVRAFVKAYRQTLAGMHTQPETTVTKLMAFYGLPQPVASAVHARLWQADGLNPATAFDHQSLAETERVFAQDTGLEVPTIRRWVLEGFGL